MLTADIVGCWQGFNLETGQQLYKITLRLPGNKLVDQAIDSDYFEELVNHLGVDRSVAAVTERAQQEEETVEAPPQIEAPPQAPEETSSPEQEQVDWTQLPESVLPKHIALAMRDHNLPNVLPASKVVEIRDAIAEQYEQADWDTLAAKYGQAVSPRVKKPAAGVVEWGEGTAMRPSIPSRTVQKDSMGYPIVPQQSSGQVDPGEVAPRTDDDGVPEF